MKISVCQMKVVQKGSTNAKLKKIEKRNCDKNYKKKMTTRK